MWRVGALDFRRKCREEVFTEALHPSSPVQDTLTQAEASPAKPLLLIFLLVKAEASEPSPGPGRALCPTGQEKPFHWFPR